MRDIADLREFYKMMSPRLTTLVTTMDARGIADVATYSFVSPVSFDPPMLMLSVGINKHSYWNLMSKKEFVVNIPTEAMSPKLMVAGEPFDPHISKLERGGFETFSSRVVGPPSLAGSAACIECYLEDAKKYGDHVIIVGKVVAITADEGMVDEENRLRVDKARPPLHITENRFAFPYVEKKME